VVRTPASLCCVLALSVVAGGPPHPGHGGGKPGNHHSSIESQGGYTCTWASAGGGSVTCVRSGGVGLRIVVSRKVVQVRAAAGAVLFSRRQPGHAHGPVRERPAGVVFSHSEDGLLCEWSSRSGGAVFCGTADRRGYAAGVLATVATVLSSSGGIVYIGKQP
jgi:hypothetical protein